MKREWIQYLRCPACGGKVELLEDARPSADGRIEEGRLGCSACPERFPVSRWIPRFVPAENYASSFGFEWQLHSRTQYDETSEANLSERRFYAETRWERNLPGERILEVGSGSGRFTAVAAKTGALVISTDYSCAVDANFASNGKLSNVFIVQADLYHLPFEQGSFDKLFCLGVLQHTPDVEKSFKSLPPFLKPGGRLAIDVYAKMRGVIPFLLRLTSTHYRIRPITRRLPHEKLYRLCERYVRFMWPLAKRLGRLGHPGAFLLRRLLIPPYFGVLDLPEDRLREWITLDMFDALSPAYDQPQFLDTVEKWFRECNLREIDVDYGYNGINGRGRRAVD
jgi:SAM-dependent methyltransferase